MKDHHQGKPQPVHSSFEHSGMQNGRGNLLIRAVALISQITASPVCFFHFVEPGNGEISLGAWSSQIAPEGSLPSKEKPRISLPEAGEWADCIRNKKTILRNHPGGDRKTQIPSSRPEVFTRLLATPVTREGNIVAVMGAGNKPDNYSEMDAQLLENMADLIWDLTAEKKNIDFLRTLMDISNDWETLVDEENVFRYCSSNCEKITGFTCDDFKENPNLYIEMVHPDDRMAVLEHFKEMHLNRDPSSLVFRMATKSGEERWIELYCRAFYDAEGNYLGRRGSNRDITERKKLENALKAKEESLERSQRIAGLGSYEVDLQSGHIMLSRECRRIIGFQDEDAVPIFSEKSDIVHPDDQSRVSDVLTTNIPAGREFAVDFRIIRKDGAIRYVQNFLWPKKSEAGEVTGLIGTVQDITDKKIIEMELLDSEKRFRSVLDNASSMAVQGYSPDGTTQYWNEASTRLYGYTREEALGKNLLDLIIPPEMKADVKNAIAYMAGTGEAIPSSELSLMHKDGSRVNVYSSHTIVERANLEPELFCIDLDLSDLKKTEAALRESEGRFRSLVESISDIIFSVREDGNIVYVTPTWKQLFESDIDNPIGIPFLTFIHPDEFGGILDLLNRLLLTGEKVEGYELRIKDKNGIWQWHSINASLQKDVNSDSRVIIGSMRNISELKLAQQIRDAEIEIMNICHFAQNKQSLLRDLVDYFKRLTGFEAVGVRLHEGDDFPFYFAQGFSDDFLKIENSVCQKDAKGRLRKDENGLPLLDCMCGNILSGGIETDESSFTRFGSFFTNSTTDLAASAQRLNRLGITRNNCNRFGYESVALMPLHAHGKILGLFQFNDRRRDRFAGGMIQQLENLVDYASLALANLESLEALRESEEKYRILVENASEAIFVLQDGYCNFCNPRTLEISGYSNHDVPRKGFLENIHPEDRHLVEKYLREKQAGKSAADMIECRFVTRTGEMRWVDLSSAPISWMGKPATLNFMADITERKIAQFELLNSEIKMQDLIDNLDGIVCAVDKNMKLMVFNREFQSVIETLFGSPASVGDSVLDIVAENQGFLEEWGAIYSRVLSGEHIVLENEYVIAGLKRCDEITHIPIRNASQEIVGMTIVVRDISERKRAEHERRALEERFFSAFHTSPDSISINKMRDGIFIDVNQGFSVITGYSPADVIGKSALEVNLWENQADREKLITGIREKGEMINFEAKTRTKTGEVKYCLMSARKINVNGEDCVLMMTRDISDRKTAEARLNEQIEELRRWHAVTLGRETRIIDLKNEVNELLIKAGKPPRYIVSGES